MLTRIPFWKEGPTLLLATVLMEEGPHLSVLFRDCLDWRKWPHPRSLFSRVASVQGQPEIYWSIKAQHFCLNMGLLWRVIPIQSSSCDCQLRPSFRWHWISNSSAQYYFSPSSPKSLISVILPCRLIILQSSSYETQLVTGIWV